MHNLNQLFMSKHPNNQLEAYYTEEGRINYAQSSRHEYNLTDHLGNTRVCFMPNPNLTLTNPTTYCKVLQQTNYYAYGLPIGNLSKTYPLITGGAYPLEQKYQYNGKELNPDHGLMWNDYGARWLDLQRGVFVGIDPIADKFAHVNGYNYAEDNPISAIDLWGLQAVRTTKVQQQLMTNLNNSKNLDVHTQTACYPTTWKRVSAAYKDAGLNAPAELKNKGTMVQDRINPDYGRWWPTGSADFTLLAKSGIENKKWADLPEKYRGEGFPGAMAYAGFADDPQNAWDGNLQPGAVLQMWNSPSDYEGIKSGEGYDDNDANSWARWATGESTLNTGHSAIFTGYKRFLGIIIGINYTDQKGKQSISRGSLTYRVIRGANLKDQKQNENNEND